jgi:hypothetical protein
LKSLLLVRFLQTLVNCHGRFEISSVAEHLPASQDLFAMHVTSRSWNDNEDITADIKMHLIRTEH